MATAGEWVKLIVSNSAAQPMPIEDVWRSLEKHVGQGPRTLERVQDVLDYIDRQLIERNNGPAMRCLWAAVADYLEKVQEGLAAA